MDVVAVDWSGAARGAESRLWLAHARNGHLVELSNGRTREQVVAHLIALKSDHPEGLAVGLDFSFSLPAWFLRQRGLRSAADLWHLAAGQGEEWLAACQPPFWGKRGDRRPDLEEHRRRTERDATVGGITAKSTFQIRGPGTVGTGSIRGMPYLLELQRAGFSIFPFDPPSRHTVVEIYPRLLTGPVHKRNAAARADHVDRAAWPLRNDQRAQIIGSEDAFDAATSALVMAQHEHQLRQLQQCTDTVTQLEGMMWSPPNIET